MRTPADYACWLTLRAMHRQLQALPCQQYLIRLIQQPGGRAFPGQRLWTATRLCQPATLRFLRLRNREGCDVFFRPFAGTHNAGYVLVDLDTAPPAALAAMRRNGHEPCVVLESSPGHQQVWIRVSAVPLEAAVATAIARHLARLYQADRASADAFHLGRLPGFTNQKPQRRRANGYAPWVRLRYAQPVCASQGAALIEQARCHVPPPAVTTLAASRGELPGACPPPADPSAAAQLYRAWLHRLRIPQRFPQPDWSIADLWIAQQLLRQGRPPDHVAAILAAGSPGFPRRHADPSDYLRRTLTHAARQLTRARFSPQGCPCVETGVETQETHAPTSS